MRDSPRRVADVDRTEAAEPADSQDDASQQAEPRMGDTRAHRHPGGSQTSLDDGAGRDHPLLSADGGLSVANAAVNPIWVGCLGLFCALIGQVLLARHVAWAYLPAVAAVVLWALIRPQATVDRDRRLTVLNFGLAVVLGMHFWHLGQSLPGLFFDEAVNIVEGLEFSGRPGWTVWSDAISGRPTLFLYILGFSMRVFGEYWLVARITVVVVNAATVLVMVWALSPILGPRIARMAAIVFGASAYHLLFSRIVYEASISTLPLLIAVGAAARGVRDDRWRWWSVLGLALGVGLWTYVAFRLVPLFICAALAAWAVTHRGCWRRVVVGIAIAAAVSAVVAGPLIKVAADDLNRVTMRAEETTILRDIAEKSSVRPLVENIRTYGLMFFTNPQTSDQIYYSPGLGWPAAVLLWVGLGLAVGSIVRGRAALVGLVGFWWFAGLIPGILTRSIEAPHWCRTLYALPAVAVMVALAANAVGRLAGTKWRSLATTGVLATVVAGELWAFHATVENGKRVYNFFSPSISRAAQVARQRVSEGRLVLASGYLVHAPFDEYVFRTVAGDAAAEIEPLTLWGNTPLPSSSRETAVLLTTLDRGLEKALADLYPDARLFEYRSPFGEPLLWEVLIPPNSPPPPDSSAGALFRMSGIYTFTLADDTVLELEGYPITNGVQLEIPAGIWSIECPSSCAEVEVGVTGPEDFALRDVLFEDPWAGHGLTATYFNSDGSVQTQLERLLKVNERGPSHPHFRIRWDGWLNTPVGGRYRFKTESDDGSRLWIDGLLVVDNWGPNSMDGKRGSVELGEGRHRIAVEYEQLGGGLNLDITWTPPWPVDSEMIPPFYLMPLTGPEPVGETTPPRVSER